MFEEIKRLDSEEEYAMVFKRVEELILGLPEDTPEADPLMIELKRLGDMVEDYEEIHYPIATPRLPIEKDFREAFAEAIDGVLLDSPIGVAEVAKGKVAWQVNAIKVPDSFELESVPVIAAICSPDYSYGISDPHTEADKTGRAVLNIWNERVNTSFDYYDDVRRLVLVLSEDNGNICLYETAVDRYRSKDYVWSVNSEGYLVGKHKTTGKISFTWKPIGSQFFIHETIPRNAVRFTLKEPPVTSVEAILQKSSERKCRNVRSESVEKFGVSI